MILPVAAVAAVESIDLESEESLESPESPDLFEFLGGQNELNFSDVEFAEVDLTWNTAAIMDFYSDNGFFVNAFTALSYYEEGFLLGPPGETRITSLIPVLTVELGLSRDEDPPVIENLTVRLKLVFIS